MRPFVEFEDAGFRVDGRAILRGFSLAVAEGETVALIGRSGSGKTTALKLVNALLMPTEGAVRVAGRATAEWDPIRLRRRTGYVIQEVGLFPHLTIGRNVGLVPELEGWPAERIGARVRELLELVGLPAAEFAGRHPIQLSGGQRQRVGVARALAADPPLLLLDGERHVAQQRPSVLQPEPRAHELDERHAPPASMRRAEVPCGRP